MPKRKSSSGPDFSSAKSMRAIQVDQFGNTDVLKLKDSVPIPELSPSQVLVKVFSFGVNPVDTYIREGQYSRLPDLPYTPGGDGAGIVEAVGADVKTVSAGDRVFVVWKNSGSYAEYLVSEQDLVFPLARRLTFSQGAALGVPYFTAFKAVVLRAKVQPGEMVLVHGASGAVGNAAVQIARAYGATVVGTAGTDEGREVVHKAGAHQVFCHKEKNYTKKMMEFTNNQGFDVIIENLANVNLGHDIQMLKQNARVMVVGNRGNVSINPRFLMVPEASIRGIALGSTTREEFSEIGDAILKGIDDGWVDPIIDREYEMKEIQLVHHDIIHSKGAKGKLVVKVRDD